MSPELLARAGTVVRSDRETAQRLRETGFILVGVVAPSLIVAGGFVGLAATRTGSDMYVGFAIAIFGAGVIVSMAAASSLVVIGHIDLRRKSMRWEETLDASRVLRLMSMTTPTLLAITFFVFLRAQVHDPPDPWRLLLITVFSFGLGLASWLPLRMFHKQSLAERGGRERVFPIPLPALHTRLQDAPLERFVPRRAVKDPLTRRVITAEFSVPAGVLRLRRIGPRRTLVEVPSTPDGQRLAEIVERIASESTYMT